MDSKTVLIIIITCSHFTCQITLQVNWAIIIFQVMINQATRKNGTDFVPMEWVSDVTYVNNPSERPIYYDQATDSYKQWTQEAGGIP